jgi:hypothetical protein
MDDRKRLDQLMEARRIDLGMTWVEISERAGYSTHHVWCIRKGKARINVDAKVKIERAMSWPAGTVDAILTGAQINPKTLSSDHRPNGAVVEQIAEILAGLRTDIDLLLSLSRQLRPQDER